MEGQTAARTPVVPAAAPAPLAGRVPGPRTLAEWLPRALVIIVAACVALAALSAAVLPTVPSYDPWSWIVWGREVSDPHLSFVVSGGPSWKPLPLCFTAIWGLFGSAAPTLWVITARAGGLLGVVAAYRLGARLAARLARDGEPAAWRWALPVAGLVAVGTVILTQDRGGGENWTYYMFRGTSEPMLIGAVLWAIDRHLDGRHGSAFVLGVAASLIRPEAWPFILLYGVWLWVRRPELRPLVGLGWLSIPFLWFVPPWIGTGQPFIAASHAKAYNGQLGSNRFVSVLGRGVDVQLLPALLLALVAVGLAWWRRRDRVVLALGGGALAWWVIVIGMTLDGYPGLQRFYLPAAAVIAVLAGVGVVGLARLAGEAVGSASGPAVSPAVGPGTGTSRAAGVGAAVALALVAVCAGVGAGRTSKAWAQRAAAQRAVTRLDELSRAVAAVGGHAGVYPCRTSFAAVNHGVQTALAWKLHVTLGRVGTSMRHQGLDFVGPADAIDGRPARIAGSLTQRQLVARVGVWRIYRVTAPGANTRCVGA